MQFFDDEESVEILSPTAEMMPVFDAIRESFERLAALPHANALSLAWDDISFTQTGTELARWYFGRNGLSIRIEDPDDAMLGDLYHWVENHFNVMSGADLDDRLEYLAGNNQTPTRFRTIREAAAVSELVRHEVGLGWGGFSAVVDKEDEARLRRLRIFTDYYRQTIEWPLLRTADLAATCALIVASQLLGMTSPARAETLFARPAGELIVRFRSWTDVAESLLVRDAFVALDMETVARVQTGATGAHRWRLAVDGPGGHSWLDYGRVPSAVHAIGRAIAKIANLELPEDPKTSYTVGTIKGGTTVNTIAAHCEVDVDMRSVAMEELMKVEETILAAFEEAVAEENARWTKAPESSYVKLTKTKIGDRPAGQRPADCPAVNAALEGAKALGIEVTWTGSSSTDCNMPMSLGIPAVCLGTGGHTYNEHSLKEYFDSTDMHLGPQLALLTVLGITGLA